MPLTGRPSLCRLAESHAVVTDIQGHLILHIGQRDLDLPRRSVLSQIRQRLLSDAKQGYLGLRVHRLESAGGHQRGRYSFLLGPPIPQRGNRLREPGTLERGRLHRLNCTACLNQCASSRILGLDKMLAHRFRVIRSLRGSLQLRENSRQRLSKSVMNLASEVP